MEVERRARQSAPARYRPRRPSQSVLYRCVPQHLETRLTQRRDDHDDASVPEHVVLAVPKRLRYFLHRDADLKGAALRLFLRAVEQCLRAQSSGAASTARVGAVAFIHRFGSSLNAYRHFHCVVIDGVFDAATTGGVVFHAATGIDANAIAQVQARVGCRWR